MKRMHAKDMKKIMGIEDEMIKLLPKLEGSCLNPWSGYLPKILSGVRVKKGDVVLDIPCGMAGVSIPLAKKYGAKVLGYDIFPAYIEYARQNSRKQKVGHLCAFGVRDIRDVVKRKDICDVLLWIAPPHLWKTSKAAIKRLRNCVKNGGWILMADAYLYSSKAARYENYETLQASTKGYLSCGDSLVRFVDFKRALWKEDYRKARESARKVLKRADNERERKVVERYLEFLAKGEKKDAKYLGLAIWLLKVKK